MNDEPVEPTPKQAWYKGCEESSTLESWFKGYDVGYSHARKEFGNP